MSVFDRLFGRARRVTEDSATVELSVPRGPALLAGNVQGVGARERQEDSFAICNISDPDALARQGLFAVVADGMGGMDSGNEVDFQREENSFYDLFCRVSTLCIDGSRHWVPCRFLMGEC